MQHHKYHTSTVPRLSYSLLLQEDDIISWDSDELNRIHNLHIRDFKDIAVSCVWAGTCSARATGSPKQQQQPAAAGGTADTQQQRQVAVGVPGMRRSTHVSIGVLLSREQARASYAIAAGSTQYG